ncbi:hypothetical protein H6800_00005, partial [Candidatus Nomurabacteria bacterium]|nr:hypothetical protein [Candidatus Nomurabacteria bacterium]
KTDCSYDLKSKITSCYTTQDVVLNEQQGDVKAQLATFNQAMTDTGWDSEGNEIFFEQFNQIFLEPLPHQGWRALIELGYLRYTKKVEGKEIIATVNLSSKKDIKYSDYYGEDNSDARKAVADGRYYPHVSLINSQYLQGNKFY